MTTTESEPRLRARETLRDFDDLEPWEEQWADDDPGENAARESAYLRSIEASRVLRAGDMGAKEQRGRAFGAGPSPAKCVPGSPPRVEPRWGSPSEAAATLGVSRDTLDRMRSEQRRLGWTLDGDPLHVGCGEEKRHERWDLDRVPDWARAFSARQAEGYSQLRRKPRAMASKCRRPSKAAGTSLYARASALKGPAGSG